MTGYIGPFAFFLSIKIVFNKAQLNLFNTLLQGNHRVAEEAEDEENNQKNGNENADINKQTNFCRKFKNITCINRTNSDFTNAVT